MAFRPQRELWSSYKLISLYNEREWPDSARQLMDSIPYYYILKGADLINYNDYRYIFRKADSLNVFKNIYRWHNLDSLDIVELQDIAATNLFFPGAYACNILAFIKADTCELDIELPGMESPRMAGNSEETNPDPSRQQPESKMLVYPNPANLTLFIKYPLDRSKQLTLRLYNSLGQVVFSKPFIASIEEIPLSTFNNGIYNVTLWDEYELVEAQKLIVSE